MARVNHPFLKEPRTRSIWDKDVDGEKLKELSKTRAGRKVLAENFPNDYNGDGEPYGDF